MADMMIEQEVFATGWSSDFENKERKRGGGGQTPQIKL